MICTITLLAVQAAPIPVTAQNCTLPPQISRVSVAVNSAVVDGRSNWASISGCEGTVTRLVAAGADPSLRSQYDLTPLHVASAYGRKGIVTLPAESLSRP